MLALALGGSLLAAADVYALSLQPGSYHFKFLDVAALYRGAAAGALGTPIPNIVTSPPAPPVLGDVLRVIAEDTSASFHPSHSTVPTSVFDPTAEELTSIIYDLALSRITGVAPGLVELGFSPAGFFAFTDTKVDPGSPVAAAAGGFGGALDLYQEPLGDVTDTTFSTSPGSSAFVAGGAPAAKHTAARPGALKGDAYPAINTAGDPDVILMEAVFAPFPLAGAVGLLADPLIGTGVPVGFGCLACVPGELLNILVTFSAITGVISGGSGFGFLNVIGGPAGALVDDGAIPADVLVGHGLTPAAAALAGYDIHFKTSLASPPSVAAAATGWTASSEDPLHFSTVDQPATVILLGVGLIAMGSLAGRRIGKRRSV